ncbi:Metallo-dependent phosphatase-like protein [Xylogone sp. PMI_703]|nr:Metallo-dependent phosphatase-like protein [Xylogone sp. PMI_703]
MRAFSCISAFAAVLSLVPSTCALVDKKDINSQTRLAYAGSTGMTVSWNTFEQVSEPTVKYGLSPDALIHTATSNVSVTYPTSLTYNNHVKITGLEPDTLYYYLPTTLLQPPTAPYSFRTSRPAGDHTPYTMAVVVDMGTMGSEGLYTSAGKGVSPNNVLAPGERNTIESLTLALDEFDFLWHPGDIAYADYWLKEELQGFEPNTTIEDGYKVYESILNEYYDEMTPVTTVKAYMVGPGNHEANCDNGGTGGYDASICMPGQTNFTGYINHFRMPSEESGGTGNFWYSFDQGMVHYVQIDTETDLGHGLIGPDEPLGGTEDSGPFGLMNAQVDWLKADLAAVDRSKTPWVIVAGHRPWFASGEVCTACQEAFEDILVENGVDLVFAGHFHIYERNDPIKNGTADPNGLNNPSWPWYIINGAAGHYDGLDSFDLPLQPYHRFGLSTENSTYGWSKLTFHNCSHLTHEFVASNNNSVLDSATLYKNRTCPSTPISSSSAGSIPPATSTPISTISSYSNSSVTATSVPLTTSTVYTTSVITVTHCATTVTNCPASSIEVITSTIALYTTVCPVSAASTTAAGASSIPQVGSSAGAAPSTVTAALPSSVAGSSAAITLGVSTAQPSGTGAVNGTVSQPTSSALLPVTGGASTNVVGISLLPVGAAALLMAFL